MSEVAALLAQPIRTLVVFDPFSTSRQVFEVMPDCEVPHVCPECGRATTVHKCPDCEVTW